MAARLGGASPARTVLDAAARVANAAVCRVVDRTLDLGTWPLATVGANDLDLSTVYISGYPDRRGRATGWHPPIQVVHRWARKGTGWSGAGTPGLRWRSWPGRPGARSR